ncbi:MAG: elongation factor G [Candidatus Glassbacteria bacterium]|nr:elongation factor G [Candidatus Glassbacteria bacterium]
MKNYHSQDIRNLAVLGHGSCGKTSLTDALCFAADTSKRLGSIDEGNSLTDFSQDEIERKISINLAMAYAEWKGVKINLLDTPGYMDFIGDAHATVRAADNALIVVHAASGVEIGTEVTWRLSSEQKMPTAFFINMMDKEHADFDKVVEQLRNTFEGRIIPLTVPVGEGESFRGVVDLISRKARLGKKNTQQDEYDEVEIPQEMAGKIEEAYKEFVEAVVEQDDGLMEKYFDDQPLEETELSEALRKGFLSREIFPVFCGSATLTFGSKTLLDSIVAMMPDPTMIPPLRARPAGKEEEVEIAPAEDQSLVALVFKTITEPHVGELSYFRIFRGILKSGDEVTNSNDGQSERLGHLSIMQGRDRIEVEQLMAGDLGVVAKLKHTHTGNTLTSKSDQVVMPEIEFPKPVMNVGIEPKTRGDEDKISQGLKKLQEEDQTFHSYYDSDLHQMIVSGMGELHLDVIMVKLNRKFNVEAEYVEPAIPYRETVRKTAEAQGKYKKQTGGRGQYGDCWVRVSPRERGAGFEFVDKIVGGAIPNKFVPSVEKGIREAAGKGVLAGFQMVDFQAECFDGSYHSVDSSDVAFQVAGSMAFQKATLAADPVIIEPIQNVEVLVSEEYMGDVIGDLNSRRGRIMGMTSEGNFQKVAAKVPLAELYKYSTQVRSITQGRGMFMSEFSHYEEVPRELTEKIIEKSKKEKENV